MEKVSEARSVRGQPAGVCVKALAVKADTVTSNVLRALNGRHNPTQATLDRLLKLFGLRLRPSANQGTISIDRRRESGGIAPPKDRRCGARSGRWGREGSSSRMDEPVAEIVPDTQPLTRPSLRSG
jgi:hypothetical protein